MNLLLRLKINILDMINETEKLAVLLLLSLSLTTLTASGQLHFKLDQFNVVSNMCIAQGANPYDNRSVVSCTAECSRSNACVACSYGQNAGSKLVTNLSAAVTHGDCKISVKMSRLQNISSASCTQLTGGADFLVLMLNSTWTSLTDVLCWHWCFQLALYAPPGFSSLEAALNAPQLSVSGRCVAVSAASFFSSIVGGATSQTRVVAVSSSWRAAFVEESLCTDPGVANVLRLVNASWAQPLHVDVCGHACAQRAVCEFFVFNSTGCFEGSLSLYLNSRVFGVSGCSIQHKVRSWANSTLAYYTFNSSWLNLVNPGVMTAVNNTVIDVNQDGFLVPQVADKFVKINFPGFDALVRNNKPFTIVLTFVRSNRHSSSTLLLFGSCSDRTVYNGAMYENQDFQNTWYVNSATGWWQEYRSLGSTTYNLPNNQIIRLAFAAKGTSMSYYVINGSVFNTNFINEYSVYGSDPATIACLYVGYYPYPVWSHSRNFPGRIQTLGIFSRMLSTDEVNEVL